MGEWLIPFKGRNPSGHEQINFLWRSDNIYIMDNHRAALWCWAQHIKAGQTYNLFHIDRHFDAVIVPEELQYTRDVKLSTLPIEKYLAASYKVEHSLSDAPLFRYDNYLSHAVSLFKDQIAEWFFAVHLEGQTKPKIKYKYRYPWDLVQTIEYEAYECKIIINVDLDYFYFEIGEDHIRAYTRDYIRNICLPIRDAIAKDKVEVITIALSPECCGGWENAEEALSILTDELGIEFNLPE